MTKILGVVLCGFGLLVSRPLPAQAPQTAVPVEQEPRHRVVFENKQVRIYDALIPPGDLTLFHTHSFDNVFVVVSGGKGTNEVPGRPPTEFVVPTGHAGFSQGTNASYTHRIGNVGTTPLRFVVAEVLAPASPAGVSAPLDRAPGHRLLVDNERVKVYRVTIDPKQSTKPRSRTPPWLRISVSEATISVQDRGKPARILETKSGDYRWHEGPTNDSLRNVGSTTYDAIEIEWK